MKTNTPRKCWRLWIILFTLIGVTLACDTSGVDPKDPRLQAPVSNKGMALADFLGQLDIAPRGFISVPWITSPEDYSHNAPPAIEVKGWAKYYRDGEIVVYKVLPNENMRGVYTVGKKLASAEINKKDQGWSTTIQLPDERQFLAARIERKNGKFSGFSNIIYVSTGEPIPLTITSPKMDEVAKIDTVNLTGSGEPGIGLEVYVNGENANRSTQIGVDGKWEIKDVPLLMAGFDKQKPKQDRNINTIIVKAESTKQETKVTVRQVEPISLHWPFGMQELDGKEIPIGQVSAFFHNDWHMFGCYTDKNGNLRERRSDHPALDIAVGGKPIQAVASGIVTGVGSESYGNYLIVDSGGWGTLYLHIVENAKNSKVKIGQEVKAGDIVATEGKSGTTAVHLHISVRIWELNADRSDPDKFGNLKNAVNLNPPIGYKNYFFDKWNIDLYDWWGGSEFCAPEGCWKDIDWKSVDLRQKKPTVDWTKAYYKGNEWTGGYCWNGVEISSYTMRRNYCDAHPEECN